MVIFNSVNAHSDDSAINTAGPEVLKQVLPIRKLSEDIISEQTLFRAIIKS